LLTFGLAGFHRGNKLPKTPGFFFEINMSEHNPTAEEITALFLGQEVPDEDAAPSQPPQIPSSELPGAAQMIDDVLGATKDAKSQKD